MFLWDRFQKGPSSPAKLTPPRSPPGERPGVSRPVAAGIINHRGADAATFAAQRTARREPAGGGAYNRLPWGWRRHVRQLGV